MNPQKRAMDNQPTVVDKVTRVPGRVGWGVERGHLIAKNKIITDDTSVASFPIDRMHVRTFDEYVTGNFTRYEGDRAAVLDAKLGADH